MFHTTDDNVAPEREQQPPRPTLQPGHSPSSRSCCSVSARRQNGPRARTAEQPRCSQTEYKPCASAATKGTPTVSPRCHRGPLQAKFKKKLLVSRFLGSKCHIKHSVKTKFLSDVPVSACVNQKTYNPSFSNMHIPFSHAPLVILLLNKLYIPVWNIFATTECFSVQDYYLNQTKNSKKNINLHQRPSDLTTSLN